MPKSHAVDEIKDKWETVKDKSVEVAHAIKEKSEEVAHTLEKNPNTRNFWKYITSHRKESILGGFMLLGLIFSFYWLGSFVVGLATGLYMPFGLRGLVQRSTDFSRKEGGFPTFVVLVAAVFALFHVFSFVIGLVVGLGIKSILINEFSSSSERVSHQRTSSEKTSHKK